MSNWSDLEALANPVFLRVFGENEGTYTPAVGDPYPVTVCFGKPDNTEGLDPAFRHAWAMRSQFSHNPQKGDKLAVDGVEYTVFSVHPEGGGVWLSLQA